MGEGENTVIGGERVSGVIILDREEFETEDEFQEAVSKYIHPKKTEEDERKGKWPEWPMITRDDA